ncbi:uncharacterized protein BDZ83DRAFT_656240 [Colletotrichum acutatum]|uniref:Uncharacterized protein n=1 Tax=Glomerella acutata TaxID=27357 RepID=A0AAD8XA51_GLOAC|nr:uncharacterized protein BDZ83DRAFT_656240 [Colletotrichum acutatum]KAK1713744.1 hypothetical protein BDZ83DRAFT_656240 [Colletotrichum acutatum]
MFLSSQDDRMKAQEDESEIEEAQLVGSAAGGASRQAVVRLPGIELMGPHEARYFGFEAVRVPVPASWCSIRQHDYLSTEWSRFGSAITLRRSEDPSDLSSIEAFRKPMLQGRMSFAYESLLACVAIIGEVPDDQSETVIRRTSLNLSRLPTLITTESGSRSGPLPRIATFGG